MTDTRTEWAARLNRYDGTHKLDSHSADREHAEFTADSITHYLNTLNEPTRRENGVESADVVRREVTVEADGTQIVRPWQVERAGWNPHKETA